MACLKCGRETDQTFCPECLAVMEKYPVKPGSIVQLPKERSAPKAAKVRRPTITPEEKVIQQRKTIRKLRKTILILAAIIIVMAAAIFLLLQPDSERPVGQNYSTVTKSTTEAVTEPTVPTGEEEMFHVEQ